MTAWAQLLHFYQPPTQTHDILQRVAEESYRPLLAVLKAHPTARLAVNMNGVLTEMLHEHGMDDVVLALRELVERGQIEIVGSGKFHPILPLIPESERRRSIAENARTNNGLLGASKVRGFFPPELCYSAEILPAVAAAGHEWVLLSGVACPDSWPTESVYRAPVDGTAVSLLFRDDVRSNRISFRETDAGGFIADLQRLGAAHGGDSYVVTAMDAETFGHHIKGWERDFLGAAIEAADATAGESGGRAITLVQPSELLDRFPPGPIVEPHRSSWSTTLDDIAALNPYPLWQAPGNPVHALQWELVRLTLDCVASARRYGDEGEAARYAKLAGDTLQPALHSCQFWWASRRPMWEPVLIERGLALLTTTLLYAVHAVEVSEASDEVRREIGWRFSAATDIRNRLERQLFVEGMA